MKRFRDDRPADICFARGTFNSHPYVMGAMHEFPGAARDAGGARPLSRPRRNLEPAGRQRSTQRLREARPAGAGRQPVQRSGRSATRSPSRYNWMLQYYLRAEGLALSWVGTGRLIFSLNYTEADFAAVAERFVAAAQAMQRDGWWWAAPGAHRQGDPARHPARDAAHRFRPGGDQPDACTVAARVPIGTCIASCVHGAGRSARRAAGRSGAL